MNDNELFELCKDVYEQTRLGDKYPDWVSLGGTKLVHISRGQYKVIDWSTDLVMGEKWGDWLVPLYTSDYLLEKLPQFLQRETRAARIASTGQKIKLRLQVREVAYEWEADYYYGDSQEYGTILTDTPLKALLKLTIALHEAGELK